MVPERGDLSLGYDVFVCPKCSTKFLVHHPAPDSEDEDQAQLDGVEPQQLAALIEQDIAQRGLRGDRRGDERQEADVPEWVDVAASPSTVLAALRLVPEGGEDSEFASAGAAAAGGRAPIAVPLMNPSCSACRQSTSAVANAPPSSQLPTDRSIPCVRSRQSC